jgi:hypothetical protein
MDSRSSVVGSSPPLIHQCAFTLPPYIDKDKKKKKLNKSKKKDEEEKTKVALAPQARSTVVA